MKSKCILYLFLFFLFEILPAQNKQVMYGFDESPQTLMLNPGAVVSYDRYAGMPVFSNLFFQAGVSHPDINYNNLKPDEGEELTKDQLLSRIYEYYKDDDFISFRQQWELFNMGLRLKNDRFFLSFGMYQQMEGYTKSPEDILNLMYPDDIENEEDLLELNKHLGNLLGIFHLGVSVKVTEKLNVGARFKLLSGSSQFYYPFQTLGENADTNGILASFIPSITQSVKEIYPGMFFGDGNIGMGVDLGMTYFYSENIEINASLLDLDYINYKDYNPVDPVLDTGESISEEYQMPAFSASRDPVFYTSFKYKIFHPVYVNKWKSIYRDSRYVSAVEKLLTTQFGMQTYTVFRQGSVDWAVTAFASHDFNRYISTKFTYTYDAYSPVNLGLGISTHYKIFNLFATADNLLHLFKIKESNYQSVQFGMNFVF